MIKTSASFTTLLRYCQSQLDLANARGTTEPEPRLSRVWPGLLETEPHPNAFVKRLARGAEHAIELRVEAGGEARIGLGGEMQLIGRDLRGQPSIAVEQNVTDFRVKD